VIVEKAIDLKGGITLKPSNLLDPIKTNFLTMAWLCCVKINLRLFGVCGENMNVEQLS
jgi:hypothetical protein